MAGTIVADTLTHSTAGSVSTQYPVKGSAKARIEKTGDNSSNRESLNVSSLDDDAPGKCGVNFTSSFSTARYVPAGSASYFTDSLDYRQYLGTGFQNNLDETRKTAACHHGTFDSGSYNDSGSQGIVYFGDLA